MHRIPVAGPWITQKELDYVADAAANAWYTNANVYHERFEKAFREYTGSKFAMALPTCTSALHLSLAALGIGPGDEVIVPEATWIATAAPISYVGATPVFADIDPTTWTITAETLEAVITPRSRAVIPVDVYGSMPDWDSLAEVAHRHTLHIIEDSAEALGSEYRGRKAGVFGLTGVFSFHGSKTVTTGEGGMLVTDDEALFERMHVLRDHGRIHGEKMFWNGEVAYKYKMSSLQAAFGLAQIERVEQLVGRKRQIFSWYREELADVAGVTLNAEPEGVRNSYWMVTALIDPSFNIQKEELIRAFRLRDIDTRPFFYPLSSLPAYEHLPQAAQGRDKNCTAYRISPYGINLPCALNITREEVSYVCAQFKEIINHAGLLHINN